MRRPAIALRRRGVWVLACIGGGIVLAWWAHATIGVVAPSAMWLGVAGALAIVVGVARGVVVRSAVLCGLVCLGGATLTAQSLESPRDDLRWMVGDDLRLVCVEGVVSHAPRLVQAQRGRLASVAAYNPMLTRFRVRVEHVLDDAGARRVAHGALYVRVDEPMAVWPAAEAMGTGDRVRLTGFVTGLKGPSNPGERDMRARAHARGVSGSMRVARAALVEPMEGRPSALSRVIRWRDAVRARALQKIDGGGESRGVLAALLLGERDPVDDFAVESAFRRVGVAHVLAISGLHVGIVVLLVVMLVRIAGDHPRVQWAVVLCAIGCMAVLIPARAPILRAVLIVASVVAADMAGRRYDRLNMLALVAAVLLLFRPMDLFDPGFQLSFGVVAGLIALAPGVTARWIPALGTGAAHHVWAWVVQALLASSVAWSIATPIIAYHFGLVSPMAVVSSVIAIPLVGVALGFGYVGLGLMSVWGGLGAPVLGVASAASGWLVGLVLWLDGLPGVAVRVPTIGAVETIIALVLVVGWWRVVSRPLVQSMGIDLAKQQLRTTGLVAASLGLAAWIGMGWYGATRLPRDVALRIDTLAVGDGSAHLIRVGDDALLFDCGSNWYGVGQRLIPDALRALGAPRVRRAVISHADIDHFSGLLDAAESIGVREVLVTPQFVASSLRAGTPEALLVNELRAAGVRIDVISEGAGLRVGSADIAVLHPRVVDGFDRDNAAAMVFDIVVQTNAGDRRVMFFGDLDGAGLEAFCSRYAAGGFQPDVIEAPHHGSARASSIAFVRDLGPRVVIQSTGPSRVDDERWDSVRARCSWWCTAAGGAISAEVLRSGTIRVCQAGRTEIVQQSDDDVDVGSGKP